MLTFEHKLYRLSADMLTVSTYNSWYYFSKILLQQYWFQFLFIFFVNSIGFSWNDVLADIGETYTYLKCM